LERLKVVHIQKSVLSTGRAPLRLHNALIEENIDSSILSMEYDVNLTEKITETGKTPRLKAKIDNYLQLFITRNNDGRYGLFSFPLLGTDVSGMDLIRNADIIYIHWVQGGFLNFSNYRQIAKLGKPVIFFMHDMWAITGGCHHSFNCEKYMTECCECQVFNQKGTIDWPNKEFHSKKKIYSEFDNIYFISPSKWLFNCATRSALVRGKPLYHIPNIIDNNLFKPVGREFARRTLNLNEDSKIIAFGAFSVSSAYKGWPELLKALKILSATYQKDEITILIFGSGQNNEISGTVPFRTRFMGFLKDEYSTVLVYNAADVFVTPSLADKLPTTVLECLACGTPVAGFNVGGIPDMISHLENGYLAKYRDPEDLANGIRYLLEGKVKGKLLPEFAKNVLVRKHIDLINSILS